MEMHTERLFKIIREVHFDCFRLCRLTFGEYLPTAGNIGVFCQSETDYQQFTDVRKQITKMSRNPNQKYFRLKHSIVIQAYKDIPETIYTYLYIRKPSADTPHTAAQSAPEAHARLRPPR